MNEFNVTFTVPDDGTILFDLHRDSGTSSVARFESMHALRGFFASLGLQADKVAELESACSGLQAGQAYHQSMYLPDRVADAVGMSARQAERRAYSSGSRPDK